MITTDTIRGLHDVGQMLVKLNRRFEFPEVNAGGDLLRVIASAVNCMTAAEDCGMDASQARSSATATLKCLDRELLYLAQAAKGNPARADRIHSLRKSVQRQIALNQPCAKERKEVRLMESAITYYETVVRDLAAMIERKQLSSTELAGVRKVLIENITANRTRLNELVHGPLAVQSQADALSQRCTKLLQSPVLCRR